MTKNGEMIHVFDANGNEIGQTYPRRVQGLIKKGRARFTDDSETAIVLTDENNEHTEACPPMIDINIHHSEDRKMFENTMEMNTAAEVLEAVDAVEPAEETVNEEIPEIEIMPEELRRLYDKLDEIDREISNLNKYVEVDLPDEAFESTEDLRCMTSTQTARLANMIDNWGNIREDTVHMIEAYKKERAPKENPLEVYAREQIDFVSGKLRAQLGELTERFANGDIEEDEYRVRFNTLVKIADERVMNLLKGDK